VRDERQLLGIQRYLSLIRFDYVILCVLILLLFPAFTLARLPFGIDLVQIATAFWGGTAVDSAAMAIFLVVVGFPLDQTLMPVWSRYRAQKVRIAIAVLLAVYLVFALGFRLGLLVTVDALGVVELMERKKQAFEHSLIDIFVPALFLFCGLVMVFAFNHAIAGIRFAGTYDEALNRLDWTLFHANVSSIAHWGLNHLPPWFFKFLEFVYFGLYTRIGAVLVLTALLGNQKYAVKYVRTLLICFAIALVVFFVFPAKGPYSICPIHLSNYPRSLPTFWTQESLLAKARMLWAHTLTPNAALVNLADYYISFPCMHAALPIVGLWFLRPWRRIALFMLVLYVGLLLPAIILLEWHYIVDLFGGFAAAFLAIWLADLVSKKSPQEELQVAGWIQHPAFQGQPGTAE
jgi:hypothetical protein